MAKINALHASFNRGRISPLGLARVGENDKASERVRLSAETQTNWMPRTLGSMMLRPGLGYIASSKNNGAAIGVPFIYSFTDQAFLEFSDYAMRVFIDDAPITRVSVSTAITNGTFDSALTGWTDADESGATSQWQSGGYMALLGTGFASAVRYQQVTVAEADKNKKHALNIVIAQGKVNIKIGTTAGNDDYGSADLTEGNHSIAFTPAGNFYIQLSADQSYTSLVDSIAVASSGDMVLTTIYPAAALPLIRWDQSADVVYISAYGYAPYKVERRGTESWSIVKYLPEDGPFRTINTTGTTIAPSATSGDITLTASSPIFKSTNVGGLYKIESIGQTVSLTVTAENQFTDPIRVTGVDNSRIFNIVVDADGSWSGTIKVQRSVGEPGDWSDVSGLSYTGDTTTTHDDSLDNQIIYYRIGCKTGGYSAGTAAVSLSFGSGSNTGIARVTAFNSVTEVNAIVLNNFGGTDASSNWYEGLWSDRRGYPSAMAIDRGRMATGGKGRVVLSESDGFEDYDEDTEGDAGPINKTVGSGPSDNINWIFSGKRLVMGTDTREISIAANSFGDPLTPTDFQLSYPTTYGSAQIPPAIIDSRCIFVQRGGTDIIQLIYDDAGYTYGAASLTTLIPEIGEPGVVRLAVQRQPDTRIHAVRSDGTVAVMVNDPSEDVSCWVDIETDGTVEDVFVLPGSVEDSVYYLVNRTINGATKRYWEKWALESECQGGTLNKQLDSFITYSGVSTTSLTGLSHLEGETVKVWGDGRYNGSFTVSSGAITLTTAVEEAVIGLTYTAQFKSTKLAYAAQAGTALTQKKRIDHLAFILYNTHYQGLQYGASFDYLDPLPPIEDGVVTPADTIWSTYDKDSLEVNGIYDTDSRICLQATAPYPCTVLAAIITLQTYEKI